MTRDEAVAAAARLGAGHADRATHRWIPREAGDGSWEVAKVRLPPALHTHPLRATVESKPRPPQPDDPRTPYDRNVGGPWVG